MLLWCIRGAGTVTINGNDASFYEGVFLVAPWGHSIRYASDSEQPLAVGAIHVVPDASLNAPSRTVEVHDISEQRLQELGYRDSEIDGLSECIVSHFSSHRALNYLAEYILRTVFIEKREWHHAATQAELLLDECRRCAVEGSHPAHSASFALVSNFIRINLREQLFLAELASRFGISVSTLNRMFKDEAGMTAHQWIILERLDRARRLLTGTSQRVNEIAREVGIESVHYFSRQFKQHFGVTPLAYRRQQGGGGVVIRSAL
jgi:AraC-like DNA-binding protein